MTHFLERRHRRNWTAAFLLLLMFLPCLVQAAETVEVNHSLGTTTVPVNPKRIVAFDLSILDSIDALGVAGVTYAIPKQVLPAYLTKFLRADVVDAGGMKDPNLERIYEFAPDVIFISPRQTDYYEKLSEIAPTVCMSFDYRNFMADFDNSMHVLGKIFAMEDVAARKAKEIGEKAQAVAKKAGQSDKTGLIIMVNDGAISAYGPGSRFGIVHDVLKLKPADQGIKASNHGQSVDFEYLARTNPDILLVINRNVAIGANGGAGASTVLDNELVQRTKAGKTGKIINLDSAVWYLAGSGIQSLDIMIGEVGKAFD